MLCFQQNMVSGSTLVLSKYSSEDHVHTFTSLIDKVQLKLYLINNQTMFDLNSLCTGQLQPDWLSTVSYTFFLTLSAFFLSFNPNETEN